jgi:hypothetical protein
MPPAALVFEFRRTLLQRQTIGNTDRAPRRHNADCRAAGNAVVLNKRRHSSFMFGLRHLSVPRLDRSIVVDRSNLGRKAEIPHRIGG